MVLEFLHHGEPYHTWLTIYYAMCTLVTHFGQSKPYAFATCARQRFKLEVLREVETSNQVDIFLTTRELK